MPTDRFALVLYALLWKTADVGLLIDWRRSLLRKRQGKIAHVFLDACECGVRGWKLPFFAETEFLNQIDVAFRDETAAYNTAFAQEIQTQLLSVLKSHKVPESPRRGL